VVPKPLLAAVREFSVVQAIEVAAMSALESYELEPVIPESGIPELKVRLGRRADRLVGQWRG
jgi:hypothetical protein